MPLRTRHAQRAGPDRSMSAKNMPRRADATGEALRNDRLGGTINFDCTRNIAEQQAKFIARRSRVSPALARAIAAIVFESQETAR